MCGIAGIWHFNGEPVSEQKLIRFTDSMVHRGPDGFGYQRLADDSLGLGHRRLSILDLTDAGKQPFYYLDRYWIVYNGEVFNFMEIKNHLEKQGYQFKTGTDTEVIVAAYDHYGKACLQHFNGMWAIAIWDMREKTLFLSRDRFGVKPLYYSVSSGRQFAFASETRAFKHLEGFNRQFDDTLLAMEMQDSYTLEGLGYTVFKGINQLLPGHYMLLNGSGEIKQTRWWHIETHAHQKTADTIKQQAEEFYEIFRDACRIRLISDVPVATALSGGLDSTAIYSTVADILNTETHARVNKNSQLAVSAIFPGLENDEQRYVEQALTYTNGPVKWVETDYTGLPDQIEYDTELFDSIATGPVTAISSIYRGMKQAGITVSLDGHGVDEMLYGYLDMVYGLYNQAKQDGPAGKMKAYGNVLQELYHPATMHETRTRFSADMKHSEKQLNHPLRRIKRGIKAVAGKPADNRYMPPVLESLSNDPYDFSSKPVSERMLYYETFQHTLPALLRNFDRAAMMNSVEIRMPFMDWRLVSYMFSLPAESKIGQGYTKLVLREAMKGRMAESIRTRTHKIGVGSPVKHWFDHYLKEWLFDKVSSSGSPDKKMMERSLRNYYEGNQSIESVFSIWKNINLELIA